MMDFVIIIIKSSVDFKRFSRFAQTGAQTED